jgi:hypothetical protein
MQLWVTGTGIVSLILVKPLLAWREIIRLAA